MTMDLFDKLRILADSAKYDVACTSSGVDRSSSEGAASVSATRPPAGFATVSRRMVGASLF